MLTFVTNGVLIFIFSVCLFPLIYCYKTIHQKLLRLGILPAARTTTCSTSSIIHRNIPSISYSINEISNPFNETSISSSKLPPSYDKIEKTEKADVHKADLLPSYDNVLKLKKSNVNSKRRDFLFFFFD